MKEGLVARGVVGAAIAAILLVVGCGSADDSEPSSTATGTSQPPAGTTIWGRRDAPPAGVRRQVEFFGVGDSVCGPTEPTNPTLMLDQRPFYQTSPVAGADDPELGETLSICPRGFDIHEPVRLELKRPDGSTIERVISPGPEPGRYTSFWLGAEWPTGRHRAVATQDARSVALPIDIVKPLHRGVRTPMFIGRENPNPLPVMVVGQPPDDRVTVDIYRQLRTTYRYATSIEIETDTRGLGERRFPIGDTDSGRFVLRPRVFLLPADDEDRIYVEQEEGAWVYICPEPPCE